MAILRHSVSNFATEISLLGPLIRCPPCLALLTLTAVAIIGISYLLAIILLANQLPALTYDYFSHDGEITLATEPYWNMNKDPSK